MDIKDAKEIVEIAAKIVQTGAILVGGWWTWHLFVRHRQGYARATVTHAVTSHPLDAAHQLLHVVVGIENVGNIEIPILRVDTTVQQVLPLSVDLAEALASGASLVKASEVAWPVIGEDDQCLANEDWILEPSEKEHLYLDFVISHEVSLVQLHTRVFSEPEPDAAFWENAVFANLAPG